MRHGAALSAALICLAVFGFGALGIRQLVLRELAESAENTARTELNRVTEAYRLGARVLDNVWLDGDAMFEVVTDSGETAIRSSNLTRLDPSWTALPPAPADAPADWTTTTSATLRPGKHPHWQEYRTYPVVGKVVDQVPASLVEPLGRQGSRLDAGQSGAVQGDSRKYRLTVYMFVLPWDAIRTEQLINDTLAFFVPLAVLVSAGVAWFTAGRALRPVEAIRREMASVSEHNLDRRVPVPRSRDEIARLATTTNATLDRLEGSHRQQEQFVADASHELRSPLAGLRAGLEVALAHPDRAEWPEVARRSLMDVERLQRVTTDLLLPAVNSSGGSSSTVDLGEIAREQVAERGPAVSLDVSGPALVLGEPVQLERLVRNLLDNAVRHARSAVSVTVRTGPEDVVLEVLDDGPGIPEADRERVFERFTRLDDARTRDAGGSGLGLTIARDIAVRHGGSLRVAGSESGARLVAGLPRADR